MQDWNKWRKDNPEKIPFLEGADFSNLITESGLILLHVDLSNAKLKYATFENSHFFGRVNFKNAILQDVNFSGVTITLPIFEDAWIIRSQFQGSVLRGATFKGAVIEGCNFSKSILTDVTLQGSTFKKNVSHHQYTIKVHSNFLMGTKLNGAQLDTKSCLYDIVFDRDRRCPYRLKDSTFGIGF